ncbi:MAG: hypothetical protein NC320_01825 [Clostridium sp.]|nr:hypothetical protein [Clostridium sp.]
MNQFVETRNLFANTLCAVCVECPITYDKWLAIGNDLKAAALFVNFYDEITLAWSKAKSEFTPDENGVSTVMQYLIKNVPIIMSDPKKYDPKYIYRVAYNSMGCLRRVQRDADHYNLTMSNYVSCDENDEFDLFSTMIGDDSDMLDTTSRRRYSAEIDIIIDNLDDDAKKFVEYLLGSKTLGKRVEAKREQIISELRNKFGKYRNTYCGSKPDDTVRFGRIFKHDDEIESAVVEMTDGSKATYYGETRVTANGNIKIVFFGDKQDYIVPLKIARNLKVIDVEWY